MNKESQRTWVEIDRNALLKNFKELSGRIGVHTQKMAVVKSNAYGHGMVECAKTLEETGADFLGVDSFEEALELRDSGISAPILVLGYTQAEHFKKAGDLGISITISNMDSLGDAEAFNSFLKVHIKADTGLHRQGFLESDIKNVIAKIRNSPSLDIEGLYTHLAAAETPKLLSFTKKQIKLFEIWRCEFEKAGIKTITHISASAASILYPDMNFSMVRFGISLYGLWPSLETRKLAKKTKLTPALSWHALVSEVKEIKKGEAVGYDCTEKVKKNSRIAVVPVGYWHGLPRHASGKAYVLLNGKRAKVLGRVSMDMIVVDVTGIKGVEQGSVATLIGRDGREEISAEELAKACGTINYEIVTRINPLIPRFFKEA